MRFLLFGIFFCCFSFSFGQDYVETQAVFVPVPEGYEVASPSITADGKTLFFAVYTDWEYKTPYYGQKIDGQWVPRRITAIDSIYNMAVSPDGKELLIAKKEHQEEGEIRRIYKAKRTDEGQFTINEFKDLYGVDAGYFQLMDTGKIYFFARKPKTGIYSYKKSESSAELDWISDAVSLPDSDSFDVLVHPYEQKLLISQYYDIKKYPERGQPGIYYYEKIDGQWQRLKRLPIPYGWGPTITPDGWFIFVKASGLQMVELKKLGIEW